MRHPYSTNVSNNQVVTTAKWSLRYFEIKIEMCIDSNQFQTQSRDNSY